MRTRRTIIQRIAKLSHRSNYPDPISFDAGDQLVVGGRDLDEYPGWIWVRLKDGNAGWAPESFLEIGDDDLAIASEAYSAQELNTNVGDIFLVISKLNGWYWVRNSRSDEGWIPVETTDEVNR